MEKFGSVHLVNEERLKRLGDEVRLARKRKFGSVEAARIKAGVSRGAWDGVEKGMPAKEFTLGKIEAVLDWPPGYVDALLAPDPADVEDVQRELDQADLSPAAREVLAEMMLMWRARKAATTEDDERSGSA